jgi:IS5 family transposase
MAFVDQIEKIMASILAKVERPFRVIKCEFGCRKRSYRGMDKNTCQLLLMFALSKLMGRKGLIQPQQE